MSAVPPPPGRPVLSEPAAEKTSAISPQSWWDVAVLTALSLIAVLGFQTAFGDYNFLLAGVGGLIVGTGAALLASLLRLSALPAVLIGIVAYFLLGTVIAMPDLGVAGVLPSLASLSGLVFGAVFGWADILTLQTPVQAPYYMAVLPYFATWVVAFAGSLLSLRWLASKRTLGRSLLVLAFPTLLYVASILLGTDEPYFAAVRGIGFAALALVWLSRRHARAQQLAVSGTATRVRGRVLGIAGVVAGAVVIGVGAGYLLSPPPENRFVLREEIVPPFDPAQYPSPLAGFREYTKLMTEDALFTVTGLQPDQKIRLAVVDTYDGIIFNAASPEEATDSSGSFGLVGSVIPEPTLATIDSTQTLEFQILDYSDLWLPLAGYAEELRLEDETSSERADDFRYNASTGTAVFTSGVGEGFEYSVDVGFQAVPSDQDLAEVPVASLQQPAAYGIPESLLQRAQDYAGETQVPIEQLRNIETQLQTNGFLSHGRDSDAVPSRAGHGADRLDDLFTLNQMIGDQEQYAAAMALMARSLNIPARVVVGFAPVVAEGQETVTVVGDDVTAWVEVPFEGIGWVSFYPTPDETDIPQDQVPKPQLEPQPQVRQPPRVDDEDDDLLTEVKIDDSEEDPEDAFAIPGWVWYVAGGILIPLALYFIPLLIIAGIKARRRKRRYEAAADRSVAGSWAELTDRFAELGYTLPRRSTRTQTAASLEAQYLDFAIAERARDEQRLARAAQKAAAKAPAAPGIAPPPDPGAMPAASAPAAVAPPLHSVSTAGGPPAPPVHRPVSAADAAQWGAPAAGVPQPPRPVSQIVVEPDALGLRALAVRVDADVFAGAAVDPERREARWAEADASLSIAERAAGRLRRRLAAFRVRPKKDWAAHTENVAAESEQKRARRAAAHR